MNSKNKAQLENSLFLPSSGFNAFGFSLMIGRHGTALLSTLSLNLICGLWILRAVNRRMLGLDALDPGVLH
ncbi:hypothetical protein DPMN_126695 [Dreissena polymorpha]|uniref:Uncharacterized protein n=1 Tax=Dreissena polymorpha TaxID=45954 RepID=A0A9D4JY62_DREPO|nr:hypothetical protein DPMN_126695 [Dreissena polymorpha]